MQVVSLNTTECPYLLPLSYDSFLLQRFEYLPVQPARVCESLGIGLWQHGRVAVHSRDPQLKSKDNDLYL